MTTCSLAVRLVFCNIVLFYEHYDVYCTYGDELMFPRRIVQINRFFDNYLSE